MKPKFSVILPVYNSEKYLEETITSVLNQSFTDFELLIIDDGSSDKSLEIAKSFENKESRVSIFEQKNSGPGVARNLGIENAQGDYICFLDSDDGYKKDLLQKAQLIFDEYDVNALMYTFEDINELEEFQSHVSNKGTIVSGQGVSKEIKQGVHDGKLLFKKFIEGKFVAAPWNKIIKREVFDNQQLRFNTTVHHQDFGLTPRLIHESKNVYILHEDLYNYRRRDNSVTYSCTEKHAYSIFVVLDELIAFSKANNSFNALRHVFLNLYFKQAYHNFSFRQHAYTLTMLELYLENLERGLSNLNWDFNKDDSKEVQESCLKLADLLLTHRLVLDSKLEGTVYKSIKVKKEDLTINNKKMPNTSEITINSTSSLIRKRKLIIVALTVIALTTFTAQIFIPVNILTLFSSVLTIGCIYFTLCIWNDLKDAAVQIDKINSSLGKIKPNVNSKQEMENKELLKKMGELIEEAQYDNRRQFEKLAKSLKK